MKRKFLRGKLLVWLLAVMLIVASMTGCGGKDDEEDKDSKSRKEQSVDDEDEDEEEKDSEEDKDSEAVDSKEEEEAEEKEVEEDASKEEETVEKEDEEEKKNIEAEASSEAYDIVVKMVDACQGKVMTKSTLGMEIEMSIGAEGFVMNMDMSMSGDTYASENPYMSYSELVLDMNVLGQAMKETAKSYIVVEDGKMVTYTYMESEGQWMKEDMGMDEVAMKEQQNVSYQFLLNKSEDDFVLDSELHNINGRDAYKLSFTLTGEELQNTMSGVANVEDLMAESGMEDLDMSALTVPAVYYIDAENYRIVGMEMTIEGMNELMADMMDELMAAEGADYSMTFELEKCNISFSNISYDPVEIPALPAEVLALQDGAVSVDVDSDDVFSGEGYTIIKDMTTVTVACPEGWEVSDMQGDYVTFQNADVTQAVCYNLYDVSSREAFVDFVENTEVAGVIDSGRYVEHGVGPVIGEFESMYLNCTDFSFYYAWAPVGDVWMLVTIADMNGEDMDTILNEMLALIVEENA